MFWKAVYVICMRDIRRFFREKSQVVGSVARPALWLLIMGTGFNTIFRSQAGAQTYTQFLFPGIIGSRSLEKSKPPNKGMNERMKAIIMNRIDNIAGIIKRFSIPLIHLIFSKKLICVSYNINYLFIILSKLISKIKNLLTNNCS